MNIRALERTSISASRSTVRPGVRAATLLNRDSSTEVIDINELGQNPSSVIQYIVTLAKDCQSCNVILMSTERGVVLKTIRVISPGEPLLMWFTENILAMMNMPFLTPYLNIQGENRYICHICNNLFEYPNPLKIHLALKCNKLDHNDLWASLAKELASPRPPIASLSLNLFPPAVGSSFKFQLTESLRATTPRISPIRVETLNRSASPRNISPTSSNGPSPTSSAQISPISSSTEVSPVRSTISQRNSAFRPYMSRPSSRSSHTSRTPHLPNHQVNLYPRQLPPPTLHSDVHAAQMETFYSNIGKSKQGHLCVYCGKVYSRKYGLKIHIRTHTGYKPLKCRVCLRPFGDPSNLNKHVRLHADGETSAQVG
ncbi:PR domain zinc finger protein 13 [Fopius arisanus]|uniref:PR domain zinc finger protein 13 n=1 Tax=Fopius arisanus TaxID=64838 RepID=A0A9R1TYG1_9HYME|nr:PREDICTED: PR domain zinc finger protein 13 [Fopius arisanus]